MKKCDRCDYKADTIKGLKKVRKEYLCPECYKENRLKHRADTIKEAGIKEDLKELDNKIKEEIREKKNEYQRNRYKEINGREVRAYGVGKQCKKKGLPIVLEKDSKFIPSRYRKQGEHIVQESDAPIKIKGRITREAKIKSQSYLSMDEAQMMFRGIMKNGATYEEATERMKEIRAQLKKTRDSKSEEKAIIIKNKMLEELYNN